MKYTVPLVLASTAMAFDWRVGVGKSELTGQKGMGFDPSVINPVVGDTIIWEFRSGSHSVVESTFDAPCVPKAGGYNSQVQTVSDDLGVDADGLPGIRYAVDTIEPQWFFDQAGGLCSEGAVISVNPTQAQGAAQFVSNARGGRPASQAPTSTGSTPSATPSTSPTGGKPSESSSAPAANGTTAPAAGGDSAGFTNGWSVTGLVVAVFVGML